MCNQLLNGLSFVQIKKEDAFSEECYKDIAELIFETDDFIYPALFGDGADGKRNASILIPAIFEANCDSMFSKSNLFVSTIEGKIVGLILWHKGVLDWTPKYILEYANRNGVSLNEADVKKVREEYVSERYSRDDMSCNDTILLINVCVRKENRGIGIASRMLKSFIADHFQDPMELAVLADNRPAIILYEKHGFQTTEEVDGFSRCLDKPKCLIMTRHIPAS